MAKLTSDFHASEEVESDLRGLLLWEFDFKAPLGPSVVLFWSDHCQDLALTVASLPFLALKPVHYILCTGILNTFLQHHSFIHKIS